MDSEEAYERRKKDIHCACKYFYKEVNEAIRVKLNECGIATREEIEEWIIRKVE